MWCQKIHLTPTSYSNKTNELYDILKGAAMFKIEESHPEMIAINLDLSDNVFHNALLFRPDSKERFHIRNNKGEDFDIVYWDNDLDIEPMDAYPDYVKPPYMAQYYDYNEYDNSSLYLGFFDGLTDMVLSKAPYRGQSSE